MSGYNYVLVAVKNNLNTTVNICNATTGAAYAENVEHGSFAVVKMTVNEFLKNGIALWVGNQGSVWISSIIAVK